MYNDDDEGDYSDLYNDLYGNNDDDDYYYQANYGDAEEYAANDQFYEDHYDADDYQAVNNMEEDMAGYAYDEESEEDEEEQFAMYFNGDERIEEQNAEMEPNVFWTANVFGVLCGVVLCFMVICYIRRKRQKRYCFSRLQSKGTDFEESASEFSVIGGQGNKYDFHPVNVALNPRTSDEESSSEEEMHLVDHPERRQQGGERSHHEMEEEPESDEYADGSDVDQDRSKKQHEMLGIDE